MKVTCIGGGPAGLYFALLLKKADPTHQVTVFERNPRGNTYGWGVVFSDGTLENLELADKKTAQQITEGLAHWDDIDVHFKGKVINSTGHGFCGISRKELLEILTERALELGVVIQYGQEIEDVSAFSDSDLIIACDGIFSRIREQYKDHFKPDIDVRRNRFVWLGTRKVFEAFTFYFVETEHGWFQAHCYRFSKDWSTFIVECPEEVWLSAGIDKMEKEESIAFCENLFSNLLQGEKLVSNSQHLRGSEAWIKFPRVNCEKWYYKNIVLLGDASATAHFSIGSGSKLAMESAIELVKVISEHSNIEEGLPKYQETRRIEVLRLQNAARNSTEWFEHIKLYSKFEPEQFAYGLLTRSQRVSHENLRLRDKDYLEGVEKWFAEKETGKPQTKPIPPMFVPFKLRGMELVNRVAVSPMAMYSAEDGAPNDFHLVHFGARALGGAGLIFSEMTNVAEDARITPGCAGIYKEEHVTAWKKVVDFVHANSKAKMAIQLGHAGRKGSTKVAWEGMDMPLESGNWPIIGPSPLRYLPENQVPHEMTREDMDRVRDEFVEAAKKSDRAGFDMLELHCAHGYLLSTFISPLCNIRDDQYGGSLENRLRFPLEVFDAIRAVWPEDKPMSVRISATDWVEGGITGDDAVEIARMFSEHDADIIDVSSGQVSPDQKPVYGRMFQTPFSDKIRNELQIKTMAVGNIFEPDHVNSILTAGRADLCLLARPHLADPHWTLRAAADLEYEDIEWPKQYESGKRQLEVNLKRAKMLQGPI